MEQSLLLVLHNVSVFLQYCLYTLRLAHFYEL